MPETMVIFPFMQGEGPLLSAGGEIGLHPDPVRAYVSKQGRGPFSVISPLLEVSLPTFHSVLKGHPILWSRDCKVMGNHQKSALVRRPSPILPTEATAGSKSLLSAEEHCWMQAILYMKMFPSCFASQVNKKISSVD